MPSAKHNSTIDNATRLILFTLRCRFVPRHAFLPTTVATMFASWFYQSLPLFSFVLHYILHYSIGDNLQHKCHDFYARVGHYITSRIASYTLLSLVCYTTCSKKQATKCNSAYLFFLVVRRGTHFQK